MLYKYKSQINTAESNYDIYVIKRKRRKHITNRYDEYMM